jgi:hypothetical protein
MLGITETSAAEAAAPVITLSQKEPQGSAPSAGDDEGQQSQTERRRAG